MFWGGGRGEEGGRACPGPPIYAWALGPSLLCSKVSKSGSECVSVNLNRKNVLGGGGEGMPPDPLSMLGPLVLAYFAPPLFISFLPLCAVHIYIPKINIITVK